MKGLAPMLAGFLLLASIARADWTASGDSQVLGQVGVGTMVPQAQLHIQDSPSDSFALRVSSVNGAVFFVVLPNGNSGIGLSAPAAHLDVNGSGDNKDVALLLRVGNSSSTTMSQQIVFASTTGAYGHSLVTQAALGQTVGNSLDFFLWNSTGQPNAAANLEVLSLSAPTASTWSVHVDPVGTPNAELEVSDGVCTGCGTIIRAAAVAPSSRERKTDIVYFDDARRKKAAEDVRALRHATFRYKRTVASKMPRAAQESNGPALRGLIYEDAPESIRGSGKTLVLDKRVLNLELALQEADRAILELEAKIAALEKNKGKERGGRQ